MKKLTLDETWRFCMSLWRWVAKEVRIRGWELGLVEELKEEWLDKKGFPFGEVDSNCFFCAYKKNRGYSDCRLCPGRKIDKDFDCFHIDYDFAEEPIKFYNNLVSLNRKRLAKKGTSK